MQSYKSDVLNVFAERGFLNQVTDLEGLDAALATGRVTAYCGYDPTAPSLHIGHLITIMMLYWLQQSGHTVITLMGGGTGLVGDPSFKDKERPLLTEEFIASNISSIQGVFGALLQYGADKDDARMVNNAEWLKTIGYLEFLRDYGPHFSVNRMLGFDAISTRLEREQHLSFLEFNYSLLQAYDFVELNRRYGCTLQVSGADQWANIISGVELGRRKENITLYGLTAPLLTDASGRKMGKSEGNALWSNPDMQSDYDMYQYWRNVDDGMVGKMLRLFTTLPLVEIAKLEALQGAELNEAKKVLALEATALLRGRDKAQLAADTSRQTFEGLGRSDNLPRIALAGTQEMVVDVLVRAGLSASKGDAKRLIQGGGVRLDDVAVTDMTAVVDAAHFQKDSTVELSVGKKKHVLIALSA